MTIHRLTLTTESGASIRDNRNSPTAGPAGPALLTDRYLIEKIARFNPKRILERIRDVEAAVAPAGI